MAKERNQRSQVTQRTVNTVRGPDGNELLTNTMVTTTETDDDGNVETVVNHEHQALADGTIYHPALSLGNNPAVLLGWCDFCHSSRFRRRRRRVTVFDKGTGQHCVRCGAFLCPRHAHLGKDGKYRCRRHARTYLARRVLTFVFFKRKD